MNGYMRLLSQYEVCCVWFHWAVLICFIGMVRFVCMNCVSFVYESGLRAEVVIMILFYSVNKQPHRHLKLAIAGILIACELLEFY